MRTPANCEFQACNPAFSTNWGARRIPNEVDSFPISCLIDTAPNIDISASRAGMVELHLYSIEIGASAGWRITVTDSSLTPLLFMPSAAGPKYM